MLAADRHAVAARPSENPRNAVSAVGDVARGASYEVAGLPTRSRPPGVNVARLNQLANKGFLPFEIHADGTWLYRREQLAVVANARGNPVAVNGVLSVALPGRTEIRIA